MSTTHKILSRLMLAGSILVIIFLVSGTFLVSEQKKTFEGTTEFYCYQVIKAQVRAVKIKAEGKIVINKGSIIYYYDRKRNILLNTQCHIKDAKNVVIL